MPTPRPISAIIDALILSPGHCPSDLPEPHQHCSWPRGLRALPDPERCGTALSGGARLAGSRCALRWYYRNQRQIDNDRIARAHFDRGGRAECSRRQSGTCGTQPEICCPTTGVYVLETLELHVGATRHHTVRCRSDAQSQPRSSGSSRRHGRLRNAAKRQEVFASQDGGNRRGIRRH